MHKQFTSFDAAAVVRELHETIVGSRVNNVYQLDGKTLLFKLHKSDKPAFRLILEAGKRLHLTNYTVEKPSVPPAFCMAMRKYLRNAWLTSVEQYEFERVVVLSFRTQTGPSTLVVELFGEGNIILTDGEGKILQALIYKRMRDRNIVREELLKFAPSIGKNPFKVDEKQFLVGMKAFGDVEVVRGLARFLSVGGVYAEEVLLEAKVDKDKPSNALSEDELRNVFTVLQDLLAHVTHGGLEPCIVLKGDGGFVDVMPFKLARYEPEGFRLQPFSSFNEALDEFYTRISAIERTASDAEDESLKSEADRFKRIIDGQQRVLKEAEAEAEGNRCVGDAIYAHMGDLQILLGRFLSGKQSGKSWDMIVAEVLNDRKGGYKPWIFFDSFDAKGPLANIRVDGLKFSLGLRKTLFEEAAAFYERGKRAREKLEGAKVALLVSRKKLGEIEEKMHKIEALKNGRIAEGVEELARRRVKHKEWFEKFRWFVSSDDFLVVAGRDAVTNEVLIKKHAERDDVVFHADIVGAPFVVIKTEGKEPSVQCLREAGEFSAAFSRGWREGFGSVDVYWVKPSQLSKGGPSGESVGRGAFVVRRERNWQRGTALKLAIGVVVEDDGAVRFVGGPVEAVKAKTEAYVVIVPGDLAGKELFKRILGSLAREISKEAREKILRSSIEEIRDFVPFNKGRILEI